MEPLHIEDYSALEADILAIGCYASITANQDMVIVDGHNYYHRESTAFGEFIKSGRRPCKRGYQLRRVL